MSERAERCPGGNPPWWDCGLKKGHDGPCRDEHYGQPAAPSEPAPAMGPYYCCKNGKLNQLHDCKKSAAPVAAPEMGAEPTAKDWYNSKATFDFRWKLANDLMLSRADREIKVIEAYAEHVAAPLRSRIAQLEAEINRITDAWMIDEHIQSDGTLRPSLLDTIKRAETAEGRIAQLEARVRELEQQMQCDQRIQDVYASVAEHEKTAPHETEPVQVWADVDKGIAHLVRELNAIEGVRTDASCEGTASYRPYVLAHWLPELDFRMSHDYELELLGEHWGYVREQKKEL